MDIKKDVIKYCTAKMNYGKGAGLSFSLGQKWSILKLQARNRGGRHRNYRL